MPGQRFALIDPGSGISGDMLLGALVDAGAPVSWLESLPGRLGLDGVVAGALRTQRGTISALKATVTLPGGVQEQPRDIVPEHGHDHPRRDHGGQHRLDDRDHGPHRHIGELIEIVERAPVSDWTRERAIQAFHLLGEAEGRVHGVAALDVSLHEVGALDAVVDIVGGIEGFEQLGVAEVATRPVAVGSGWVRVAHGTLPVPAPATSYLLEGLPLAAAPHVTGEATTPTGAALLRVLVNREVPAFWTALRQGWGAGTRDPAGYPNALRLYLAEEMGEVGDVVIIATDLDDMSPEYLEPLRQAVMEAGALDVQMWATMMKKGRIGFRVEIVAPSGVVPVVEAAIFRHSTTLGVRRWTAGRSTLHREFGATEVEGNTVGLKTVEVPGRGLRTKPEFEDVVRAARALGRAPMALAERLHREGTAPAPAPVAATKHAYKEPE